MDPLIELLMNNARLTTAELAARLDLGEEEVEKRIAGFEGDGAILGYHAVVDPENCGDGNVSALIEVKLSPEREGGFDRLAERIAKFEQVVSCYLMSGGYDLAVFVEGRDLRDVASFVSERLSTLDGVLSTATHFRLKIYKQNGFLAHGVVEPKRLPVTP